MQDDFEKGLIFSGWRIVDPSASHPHQALLALHTDEILRQQGAGSGEGGGCRSCTTAIPVPFRSVMVETEEEGQPASPSSCPGGLPARRGAGTGEGDGNVGPHDEDTLLAQQDGSTHLAQQHGGDILQRSPAEVERRIAAEEDLSLNEDTCGSAAPAQQDDGGGADEMIDGIPLPLSAEGDGSTPVTAAPQTQPQERIGGSCVIDEDEPCDACSDDDGSTVRVDWNTVPAILGRGCFRCGRVAIHVCEGTPDNNSCKISAAFCIDCHRSCHGDGPFRGCGIACRVTRPAPRAESTGTRKLACDRCGEKSKKLVECKDCGDSHCFRCGAQWGNFVATYQYQCCLCMDTSLFIAWRGDAARVLNAKVALLLSELETAPEFDKDEVNQEFIQFVNMIVVINEWDYNREIALFF